MNRYILCETIERDISYPILFPTNDGAYQAMTKTRLDLADFQVLVFVQSRRLLSLFLLRLFPKRVGGRLIGWLHFLDKAAKPQ